MSRRILQVLVGFAAIQAMLGGGLYVTQGVAGLSFGAPSPLQFDPTDPAWTRVDYMYRAMAGIWFALGLMFAYMAPSIERHSVIRSGIALWRFNRAAEALWLAAERPSVGQPR